MYGDQRLSNCTIKIVFMTRALYLCKIFEWLFSSLICAYALFCIFVLKTTVVYSWVNYSFNIF